MLVICTKAGFTVGAKLYREGDVFKLNAFMEREFGGLSDAALAKTQKKVYNEILFRHLTTDELIQVRKDKKVTVEEMNEREKKILGQYYRSTAYKMKQAAETLDEQPQIVESLEEDDLTNALFYYRFSGMIAGALGFTNVSAETSSSRYVGIPEIEIRSSVLQNPNRLNISILIVLCAGIAGLGIGLIIGSFCSRKPEAGVSRKWTPRSINDYPEKRHHFHEDTMPRSIKDYYKKNK